MKPGPRIHWCKCSTPEHDLRTIVVYGKLTIVIGEKEVSWCAYAEWYKCCECGDPWHTCWSEEQPTEQVVAQSDNRILELEGPVYICSKCYNELYKKP
jgi:hypothetical protein